MPTSARPSEAFRVASGIHLRGPRSPRWHIDYLLPHGELMTIVAAEARERLECPVAACLARRVRMVSGFGSSDCRCAGHLFQSDSRAPIVDGTLGAMRAAGCRPEVILPPDLPVTFLS